MEVKNNRLKKNFLELELGDIVCVEESAGDMRWVG